MKQSRTPIDSQLLHSPDSISDDAQCFDGLCQTAEEVAIGVVSEAMKRETSATGAEILAEEARKAISLVDENPKISELIDDAEVRAQLRQFLEKEIPPPTSDEVAEQAHEVVQLLVASWLELVRSRLEHSKALSLSRSLLPTSRHMFLSGVFSENEDAMPFLMNNLSTYVVDDSDVRAIMEGLQHSLFSEPRLLRLPMGISMVGHVSSSQQARAFGAMTIGRSPSIDLCALKHSTLEDLVEQLHAESWKLSFSGSRDFGTSIMPAKLGQFATALSDDSAQAILGGVEEKLLAGNRAAFQGTQALQSKTFKSQT